MTLPPIDWLALSRVIPEAVLAVLVGGGVGWFMLKVLAIFKAWMSERDSQWNHLLSDMSEKFTTALTDQQAAFHASLEQQRIADREWQKETQAEWRASIQDGGRRQGETMAQVVTDLKRVGDALTATNAFLASHDTFERQVWQDLAQSIRDLTRKK